MKKLISMLMAGAMILALSAPAMGTALIGAPVSTESNKTSATTTVKGATNVPDIKLKMPTVASASAIVVNPYYLSFASSVNGTSLTSAARTDQIISPTFLIENKSNCKLNVGLAITTTLGGNMKLAAAALGNDTGTTKTNTAFIKCVLKSGLAASDINSELDVADAAAKSVILKAGEAKLATDANVSMAATDSSTPNYLAFTFTGDAASAPTTPWDAKDTVSIAMAWTFTAEGEVPSVTPAPAAGNTSLTALTLNSSDGANVTGFTFATATATYTGVTAVENKTVVVAATAESGWTVSDIKYDGSSITSASNTFTVASGAKNLVVTVSDGTNTETYTITITGNA